MTQPVCNEDDPESRAGEPVPDPWDEPQEVSDGGELVPGPITDQPQD